MPHHTIDLLLTQLGRRFDPSQVQWDNPETLRSEVSMAQYANDWPRQMRAQNHLATTQHRFDFTQPNLNAAFPEVEPEEFGEWLARVWAPAAAA